MHDPDPLDHPPPPRWQFNLRTVAGVFILVAVAASTLAGILRAGDDPSAQPAGMFYILLALIAPGVAFVMVGTVSAWKRWRQAARQGWIEPTPPRTPRP